MTRRRPREMVCGIHALDSKIHDECPACTVIRINWRDAEIERLRAALAAYRDVTHELQRAVRKFPTWPTDPLHALAVLGEEFGELTKAIVQHTYEPQKSTLHDVRTESIQTAAMAVRFLMSLDVYEYQGCEQHTQDAARAAGRE